MAGRYSSKTQHPVHSKDLEFVYMIIFNQKLTYNIYIYIYIRATRETEKRGDLRSAQDNEVREAN